MRGRKLDNTTEIPGADHPLALHSEFWHKSRILVECDEPTLLNCSRGNTFGQAVSRRQTIFQSRRSRTLAASAERWLAAKNQILATHRREPMAARQTAEDVPGVRSTGIMLELNKLLQSTLIGNHSCAVLRCCCLRLYFLHVKLNFAAEPAKLPRVFARRFDSHGLRPTRREATRGQAVVISFKNNGSDSTNQLKRSINGPSPKSPMSCTSTAAFTIRRKIKDGQVPNIARAIRQIIAPNRETLRKQTGATVIFALTTRSFDERAIKQRADKSYDVLDAGNC